MVILFWFQAIVYGIPELQTLHLGGNDFGGGQAEELYGCLKSMHKLESLNLAENQLTDECAFSRAQLGPCFMGRLVMLKIKKRAT